MTVIERAIESAKNRKYKLEEDLSYDISDKHRKKAEGQKEVMQVTIEALEKQIPKNPDIEGDGYADGHLVYDTWICPRCETYYEIDYDDYDYCPKCGQAIDKSVFNWEEGEEDD